MTAPTARKGVPARTAKPPAVPPDRFRPSMARVLGMDLLPGDRIGSAEQWEVRELRESPDNGRCDASRAAAAGGHCRCPWLETPAALPRRIAVGASGGFREVFDHVWYAIAARPGR